MSATPAPSWRVMSAAPNVRSMSARVGALARPASAKSCPPRLVVGAAAVGGAGATAGTGALAGVLAHALSIATERVATKYRMRGTMAGESRHRNACQDAARAL